jgi:hypothetical protein
MITKKASINAGVNMLSDMHVTATLHYLLAGFKTAGLWTAGTTLQLCIQELLYHAQTCWLAEAACCRSKQLLAVDYSISHTKPQQQPVTAQAARLAAAAAAAAVVLAPLLPLRLQSCQTPALLSGTALKEAARCHLSCCYLHAAAIKHSCYVVQKT